MREDEGEETYLIFILNRWNSCFQSKNGLHIIIIIIMHNSPIIDLIGVEELM